MVPGIANVDIEFIEYNDSCTPVVLAYIAQVRSVCAVLCCTVIKLRPYNTSIKTTINQIVQLIVTVANSGTVVLSLPPILPVSLCQNTKYEIQLKPLIPLL